MEFTLHKLSIVVSTLILSLLLPISVFAGTVDLTWTAVNANPGKAFYYEIRYSENPINDNNWDSAYILIDSLYNWKSPKNEGESEHFILPAPNGSWYFALKAYDYAGNASGVSNTVLKVVSGDEYYSSPPGYLEWK